MDIIEAKRRDKILTFLQEGEKGGSWFYLHQIYGGIGEVGLQVLTSVQMMLIDQYVESAADTKGDFLYHIKDIGRYYISQGGYTAQVKKVEAEEAKRNEDRELNRNLNRSVIQTNESVRSTNKFIKLTFVAIVLGAAFQCLSLFITHNEAKADRDQLKQFHQQEVIKPLPSLKINSRDSL